jgi:diaminopimelate epimerase
MKFFKMNGAGNSFVIFDARREKLSLTPERIREIADPVTGAGADQIIAMEPSIRGDVFMRIWNKDGGEVAACGNATRCVASLVMEEQGSDALTVETAAGRLAATRNREGRVSVDMGSPLLKWEEIPLSERMDTRGIDLKVGPQDAPYLQLPGAVNMGNPHCVFFVPDVSKVDVAGIGAMIEHHPLFPQATNVEFVQVNSPRHMRVRVWERGVGITQACGTGACASVVAANRRGLVERSCVVQMDGGDLQVHWREDHDRVILTGPVELEFEGKM